MKRVWKFCDNFQFWILPEIKFYFDIQSRSCSRKMKGFESFVVIFYILWTLRDRISYFEKGLPASPRNWMQGSWELLSESESWSKTCQTCHLQISFQLVNCHWLACHWKAPIIISTLYLKLNPRWGREGSPKCHWKASLVTISGCSIHQLQRRGGSPTCEWAHFNSKKVQPENQQVWKKGEKQHCQKCQDRIYYNVDDNVQGGGAHETVAWLSKCESAELWNTLEHRWPGKTSR